MDTTYRNEALERWLTSIRSYKVLSVMEEEEIIQKYKDGNKAALDTLIKGNQRFLFSVARTFSRDGNEILDLISEGNIGLLEAIEKYDLTYGIRFLSFAVYYIRKCMLHYLDKGEFIKHKIKSEVRTFIKKTKEKWLSEHEYPIPDWILLDMVKEEFDRDFKHNGAYCKKSTVYFECDLTDNNSDCDSVIDKASCVQNDVIEELNDDDNRTMVMGLMDAVCKSNVERDVLIGCYGLFGTQPLTENEIAKKHNLELWQVGYLRRKLVDRMRNFAQGKKIRLSRTKFQPYVEPETNN